MAGQVVTRSRGLSPGLARALLAAYIVIPALLVLGPLPVDLLNLTVDGVRAVVEAVLGHDAGITRPRVDAASNVLLFIPIGLLLAPARPRTSARRLVFVCACASAAI